MANTTYLELTNQVLRLLNEVELTSSNFDDSRGVHSVVKQAINSTLNHINSEEYEWPFNFNEESSQALTVGENYYTLPANYKVADWDSFFVFNDGTLVTGTYPLKLINKDTYLKHHREVDFDNLVAGRGIPRYVFPYGQNKFGVTPVPDKAYTIKFDYYSRPTQLVAWDDETVTPVEYDYVITLGAMWYGNLFKSDEGAAERAEKAFTNALNRMRSLLINRPESIQDTVVNFGKRRYSTPSIETS